MRRHHLENLGVDGRLTLRWILKEWKHIGWIYEAQVRDQ